MYKVAVQQSLFDPPTALIPKTDNPSLKTNNKSEDLHKSSKFTNVNSSVSPKAVKQIVFIYSDNTFEIYHPTKSD